MEINAIQAQQILNLCDMAIKVHGLQSAPWIREMADQLIAAFPAPKVEETKTETPAIVPEVVA
jgi:hypothetical protein